MTQTISKPFQRGLPVLPVLAGVLVVKVTIEVVAGYVNYFPPSFRSDFLHGREDYFWGSYRWPFYAHILAGPPSLLLGLLLLSERFRQRYPRWHRRLGRIQAMNVLFVVAPSGLWMAGYASTGPVAVVGFALLAILTGVCVALGWRAAVRRRFPEHRRWMWRCYLLLCSAVTLRVAGGTAVVTGIQAEWFDPLASWASWIVPLAAYEVVRLLKDRTIVSAAARPKAGMHVKASPTPVPRR